MHPGVSCSPQTSHSSTSLLCLSITCSAFLPLWGHWTCFSQSSSFSLACSLVPEEQLCPCVPGHEHPSVCVCLQPGEGAAGSTSRRAGAQIERVLGPEAIPSPVLPAAVGLLLVEREHMLCSTHPVLWFHCPNSLCLLWRAQVLKAEFLTSLLLYRVHKNIQKKWVSVLL